MNNTNILFALGLFSFTVTAEPSEQRLAQTLAQEVDCCSGGHASPMVSGNLS